MTVILECCHSFDEFSMNLLRDLQAEFNSDWLVVLQEKLGKYKFLMDSRIKMYFNFFFLGMLHSGYTLKLRKTSFTYISMCIWDDFLSIKNEELTARTPMVVYWHSKKITGNSVQQVTKILF